MPYGKTVLHGIDQSVPEYDDLPNKGNQASECMCEDLLSKHIYDMELAKWLPEEYVPFRWDFANDGGFLGWHNLNVTVPKSTIILDGVYDVLEALVSGGAAEVGIKVESAAGGTKDILAQEAIATAGTFGLHDIDPDGTAANAIKTTEDYDIKMHVTVAAVTAGVLVGFLRCVRGFPSEDYSSSTLSSSSSPSSSSQSSSSSSSSQSSSSGGSSDSSTDSSSTQSSSSTEVSTASSNSSSSSSVVSTASSQSSSSST